VNLGNEFGDGVVNGGLIKAKIMAYATTIAMRAESRPYKQQQRALLLQSSPPPCATRAKDDRHVDTDDSTKVRCAPPKSCTVSSIPDNHSSPRSTLELLTAATATRKPKRRVRFALAPVIAGQRPQVQCTYYEDATTTFEMACDEVPIRWYSPLDFRLFKRDAKRYAAKFLPSDEGAAFARLIAKMRNACATMAGFRTIRACDAVALCQTLHRGLEPLFFQTRRACRPAIEAILEKQNEMLIVLLNGDCQSHEVEMAIAATSREWSSPARRLARVLGSGDAHVAVGSERARVAA
jgi:hypothetical protein